VSLRKEKIGNVEEKLKLEEKTLERYHQHDTPPTSSGSGSRSLVRKTSLNLGKSEVILSLV